MIPTRTVNRRPSALTIIGAIVIVLLSMLASAPPTLAAGDDRVFVLTTQAVECLATDSGERLWRIDRPVLYDYLVCCRQIAAGGGDRILVDFEDKSATFRKVGCRNEGVAVIEAFSQQMKDAGLYPAGIVEGRTSEEHQAAVG